MIKVWTSNPKIVRRYFSVPLRQTIRSSSQVIIVRHLLDNFFINVVVLTTNQCVDDFLNEFMIRKIEKRHNFPVRVRSPAILAPRPRSAIPLSLAARSLTSAGKRESCALHEIFQFVEAIFFGKP